MTDETSMFATVTRQHHLRPIGDNRVTNPLQLTEEQKALLQKAAETARAMQFNPSHPAHTIMKAEIDKLRAGPRPLLDAAEAAEAFSGLDLSVRVT